jgi:hypothetical protein
VCPFPIQEDSLLVYRRRKNKLAKHDTTLRMAAWNSAQTLDATSVTGYVIEWRTSAHACANNWVCLGKTAGDITEFPVEDLGGRDVIMRVQVESNDGHSIRKHAEGARKIAGNFVIYFYSIS